jgi:hypothetical protein
MEKGFLGYGKTVKEAYEMAKEKIQRLSLP